MIPHKVIMDRIKSITSCDKTLQLIKKSLTAGYIDPDSNKLHNPTEGTPQGSVLSPLLANIVLNDLDQYLEKFKQNFDKGSKRKRNKRYDYLQSRIQ